MTGAQLQKILKGMGLSSFENISLTNVAKILLSQNIYNFSSRDTFSFDFNNELIKINRSDENLTIFLDMKNIVGIELISPFSGNY